MRPPLPYIFALLVAATALAPLGHGATLLSSGPIGSFNTTNPFPNGITAGLDFNNDGAGSPTQSGLLGVLGSNNKSYSLTHNGITFDIAVINANQGNQNRDRGTGNANGPYGDLLRDFEQWFGRNAPGGAVEARIKVGGLLPNSTYDLSFFTMNFGAGNTTHSFYDGTSSAAPLVGTFTTSGNQSNAATFSPGFTMRYATDGSGVIDITILAPTFLDGANTDSRLTFNGMSVFLVPEPSTTLLGGLGMLALLLRRRRQRDPLRLSFP